MKRSSCVFILNLLFAGVFVMAGGVPEAYSTIVKTSTRTVNNGSADFGSGSHSFGGPSGPATITFDWSTASGTFVATGRVVGTLYWDSLWAQGCARLTIRFRNSAGTSLSTRTIERCGPGGDANEAANRLGVNQSFATSGDLADIMITVAEFANGASVNPKSFIFTHPVEFRYPLMIENGPADFGAGEHRFGEPSEFGFVGFRRNVNGTLTGGVDGVLYKDTLDETNLICANINITYRTAGGTILDTFAPPEGNCGPGGNANLGANQLFINDAFSSGSLAQIRVIVNSTVPNSPQRIGVFDFTGRQ